MKPLGFVKDWKGLVILVATVQLMFTSMCVGRENYLDASLTYSKYLLGGYSITLTCLLNKTQHPELSTNVTLYIYSDPNSETDVDLIVHRAYTLSNNTFQGIEIRICPKCEPNQNAVPRHAFTDDFIGNPHKHVLSIGDANCNDYQRTYRCMYSHEVDNCTRKVNTSADVKLPGNGCPTEDKTTKTSVSLNSCHSKNDDDTSNNNQETIIVAIVLSVLAVVATVAGICYCKKKKAKKANKENVPDDEDKKEENVSEAVEPATTDVSSGQTMDDAASMNADDAASGMFKATDATSQRSERSDDSGSSGSSDASSVKTVDASPV